MIGDDVEIAGATNRLLVGITGTIVDETKNTITIKTKTGEKKIIKSTITLLKKK